MSTLDELSPLMYYFLVKLHPDDHLDVMIQALRYMQESGGSHEIETCIEAAIKDLFPTHPIN